MQFPEKLHARLRSLWVSRRARWLRGEGDWPLALPLKQPTERQAMDQWPVFDHWLRSWHTEAAGQVTWEVTRWRQVGDQSLPTCWSFDSPSSVAATLGESPRWQRAKRRFVRLAQWPMDEHAAERWSEQLSRDFDVLADWEEGAFEQLVRVVEWLWRHPRSGLYPRQLPIAGIDSKWVERRSGLVGAWVAALHGSQRREFYQASGLRAYPDRLRMRILDPALRAYWRGCSDIEAPVADFMQLEGFYPECVIMVENLATGMAVQDLPGTIVFMRRGYAVEALAQLPWLKEVPLLLYWGDIDTHGFAILNRLRSYVPRVRSLMMDDAAVLESFADLVGEEPRQAGAEDLPLLSVQERRLYQCLRGIGDSPVMQGRRLEQERIAWDFAWLRITSARSDSNSLALGAASENI
ncbi:MAG TPA: Wadjet anti-phage system protein JetD domain-containing protein [Dyella sp.]|uniref:DUF3322 domain-containing protein n=1 Tax=Dyella sp. TaxID=1869338 RepID=UPI002F92A792